MPNTPTRIDNFEGYYAFLRNFHSSAIKWKDRNGKTIISSSVEAVFQAEKTNDNNKFVEIITQPRPGAAKRLGRKVKLRSDWEDNKAAVMKAILRKKFMPGSTLARQLLETGDAVLVEGNYWHDNEWGDCQCRRGACKTQGRNLLGLLLMEVRSELKEFE